MNYDELNNTELVELIYRRTQKRVSKTLPHKELVSIVNSLPDIVIEQKSAATRKRLQVFIEKNFEAIQTNLPCRGNFNAGKCTIYPCTDTMHYSCYLGAKEYL